MICFEALYKPWASYFEEQHTHTLPPENVNENLSFKQSVCGAAYC